MLASFYTPASVSRLLSKFVNVVPKMSVESPLLAEIASSRWSVARQPVTVKEVMVVQAAMRAPTYFQSLARHPEMTTSWVPFRTSFSWESRSST